VRPPPGVRPDGLRPRPPASGPRSPGHSPARSPLP
jgi:hypothetical protein